MRVAVHGVLLKWTTCSGFVSFVLLIFGRGWNGQVNLRFVWKGFVGLCQLSMCRESCHLVGVVMMKVQEERFVSPDMVMMKVPGESFASPDMVIMQEG